MKDKMQSVSKLAKEKQIQAEKALQKGITGLEKNPYMKRVPTEIKEMKFLQFFNVSTGISILTSLTYYILANSNTSNSGKFSFLLKPLQIFAFIVCWGSIILNICGFYLKLDVLVLPIFLFFCCKIITVILILLVSIWSYGIIMKIMYLCYMISLLFMDLIHFRNYSILIKRIASDNYDDNCERIIRSVSDIV